MEAHSSSPSQVTNQQSPQSSATKLRPIYFVSGLGADERVFAWLKIDGYRPVHIRWLQPQAGETIAEYAERLKAQILDPEPILVGLSFGGLVALELAKQMPARQVILISSVKDDREIPLYFKLFRFLPLHRIFPFKSVLWAIYWLANWLFSVEDSNQKRLLKNILTDTDPVFLKWALHRVVVWHSQQVPERLFQLHGRGDRIFPNRWVNADVEIDGGHLIVMNRAAVVSQLIKQALVEG